MPCSACNKGLEEGSAGASCAVGAPESSFAACVEIKEPSTNPASPDRAGMKPIIAVVSKCAHCQPHHTSNVATQACRNVLVALHGLYRQQ